MTAALDQLTTQVSANTSVEQSALTLIQGLSARLNAALAADDSTALNALNDELKTSASTLAAAVAANTPVDPAATPITAATAP